MLKSSRSFRRAAYVSWLVVVAAVLAGTAQAQPVPEPSYPTIQSATLTATAKVRTWESRQFRARNRLYVHVYRLRGGKRQPSHERFIGRCAAHHIVGGLFVRVVQRSVRGRGCNDRTPQTIRLRFVSVTSKQRFLVRVTRDPYR